MGSTGFLRQESVKISPSTGHLSCDFPMEEVEANSEVVSMNLSDLAATELRPGICEHGFEQIDLKRIPGLVECAFESPSCLLSSLISQQNC